MLKDFISSPYFINLIAVALAALAIVVSVALIYKTNKVLMNSKKVEFKRDIYFELADILAKVSSSKKFDFEELISACYKARLLLPEDIGENIMKIAYKAGVLSGLYCESNRDISKISKLNEELYQLIEEALSAMRESIRRAGQ